MYTKDLRISKPISSLTDIPSLGMKKDQIREDFRRHFTTTLGRDKYCRLAYYPYEALVLTLRERLMERWIKTRYAYRDTNCKRTYYLSLEFLLGRTLSNTALNLDMSEQTKQALNELGLNLEEIADAEHDAGLGNGGLGRLAACFLDSCATLALPVMGYGIRYEYGMFRQHIENGEQVEEPDHWLRNGNPWEMERFEHTRRIHFGGHTERYTDEHGQRHTRWVNTSDVLAVPFDMLIPGYKNDIVNTLRLWSADATDEFDLGEFNAGSYPESVSAKNAAENITMVLYPNDASENGKELRLRQQYFLASASLQDVIARWVSYNGKDFSKFAEKNCFQMNDTHPTCAIPELMRLLMDEQGFDWDTAWDITSKTMAYTNHTLLPEALEKWPVQIFQYLLPRILEIIYKINAQFLSVVAQHWPGDIDRIRRMSIIEEGDTQYVRMAHLALVGSFSVNGVAALHSELLQNKLFKDFSQLWPHKFNNKTNGVTQRRWLAACNPKLTQLINETIGDQWVTDLPQLRRLTEYANQSSFKERWRAVKQANKAQLAQLIATQCNVDFNINALFDVQVKRIHEYKRQLLNILHVIHLYDRIKRGDTDNWTNRCVLIGGKAAPGYMLAKRIIKLICNVADVVNNDPEVGEKLKVAFIPNYNVTTMETICPGTDLSEQVSTAGKEASGTGNMKFMMNGAITIGTLDGANIEIREEVGNDNFFLFGLTAQQVEEKRGHYNPDEIINNDIDLQRTMHLLHCGHFNQFEPYIFEPILQSINNPHDPWMTAIDFRSYIEAQKQVDKCYQDQDAWTTMSILNAAASGKFSTDRTMQQYNEEIWKMTPLV